MINFFIKLTTLFVTLSSFSCNLPRIKDTQDADDSMITNASILDSQVNSLLIRYNLDMVFMDNYYKNYFYYDK